MWSTGFVVVVVAFVVGGAAVVGDHVTWRQVMLVVFGVHVEACVRLVCISSQRKPPACASTIMVRGVPAWEASRPGKPGAMGPRRGAPVGVQAGKRLSARPPGQGSATTCSACCVVVVVVASVAVDFWR